MDRTLRRRTANEIVGPGLAAGWAAGIVTLLIGMAHSAAAGRGPLWPIQALGSGVVEEGAGLSALVGLLLFFAGTGILGILFNSVTPRGASYAWSAAFGLVFALMAFLLVTWLILPQWAQAVYLGVSAPVLLIYHLIFGLIVPLAIPMRRNVARIESDERART